MEAKRYNIVVIGCKMGVRHIKAVVGNENANLYGICDINEEKMAEVAALYNPKKTTADWKDFVNDPEVDVAIIVTPDKLHLEMTEGFMRAGKHVLCEKPMALTVEECEKMMQVEKETGKKLMVGQVGRFVPAFRKAKRLIDEGMIGELFFVESEYAHDYGKHHRGANDWRLDPDRHAVIGGGCHAIDLLRWIAGDPTEVYGISNHKCLTDWPVDDCCVCLLKFPNNVNGKVLTSIGCKRNPTQRTVFYGTEGTIICSDKDPVFTLFKGEEKHPAYAKEWYTVPQQIPVTIHHHNTEDELKMFLTALINDEPPAISTYDGASTVAVCCAVVESCKTGLPVKVQYPEKP